MSLPCMTDRGASSLAYCCLLNLGRALKGIMGSAMAANLQKAGMATTVWNRSGNKCAPLVAMGCAQAASAAEAARASDVTFACLSDPAAAEAAVFGPGGVLEGIEGKVYIDMSTVDEHTSKKIGAAVTAKGGRYLEAPVSGSKKPAIDGTLIILAAGDKSAYELALPAFDVMGKKSFLLSEEVGAGARMKLIVNMVMGSMMSSFAEGMAMADKGGLQQDDLLEALSLGAIAAPLFAMKGAAVKARSFATQFPLKHQQKDLRLAVQLADELGQATPIAAAANELYKQAKMVGEADSDMSAVYNAVNPAAK